jgi:hypothetical protein
MLDLPKAIGLWQEWEFRVRPPRETRTRLWRLWRRGTQWFWLLLGIEPMLDAFIELVHEYTWRGERMDDYRKRAEALEWDNRMLRDKLHLASGKVTAAFASALDEEARAYFVTIGTFASRHWPELDPSTVRFARVTLALGNPNLQVLIPPDTTEWFRVGESGDAPFEQIQTETVQFEKLMGPYWWARLGYCKGTNTIYYMDPPKEWQG